jgi:hypothetical protein
MGLMKKLMHTVWGIESGRTSLIPPIDCDACHVARQAGKDACPEHHHRHARPHTYSVGREIGWGSGLDARPERDSFATH